MSINYIYLISLISICYCKELKFVFEIFRHGARGPHVEFKNNKDCYNHTWYDRGELTNVGKRMHYLLGVRNRKKYINETGFLSKTYNPSEVLFQTTDVNRTIESVYSQLQGLYPYGFGIQLNDQQINVFQNPGIEEKYYINHSLSNNESLPFNIQLMPVHVTHNQENKYGLQSEKYCPSLKGTAEKRQKRKEIIDIQTNLSTKYEEMFKTLEGTNDTSFFFNYWNTFKYADNFFVDEAEGDDFTILKNFSNFNKIVYEQEMRNFLEADYFGTNYFNKTMVQLSVSYLMRDIVDMMEKVINNQSKVKFYAFSAHDTNMAGIELFNEYINNDTSAKYSPFASNSFYELSYNNETNDYYVEYIFNEQVKYNMTFKQFKEKVLNNTMTHEEIVSFCKFEENKVIYTNYNGKYKHLTFVFCLLDVVLIALFVFFILSKGKANEQSESSDNVGALMENSNN